MEKYTNKYGYTWNVYDEMPEGWTKAVSVGSPMSGAIFIHSAPPMLGGKIALLRLNLIATHYNSQATEFKIITSSIDTENNNKNGTQGSLF